MPGNTSVFKHCHSEKHRSENTILSLSSFDAAFRRPSAYVCCRCCPAMVGRMSSVAGVHVHTCGRLCFFVMLFLVLGLLFCHVCLAWSFPFFSSVPFSFFLSCTQPLSEIVHPTSCSECPSLTLRIVCCFVLHLNLWERVRVSWSLPHPIPPEYGPNHPQHPRRCQHGYFSLV